MAVQALNGHHYELPEEEGRELFDRHARARLAISGDEFLRRWRAGEYRQEDLAENDDLMAVAMLLPLVEDDIGYLEEPPDSVRAKVVETLRLFWAKTGEHIVHR